MIAATSAFGHDSGKSAKTNGAIERCRHIKNERMRMRCQHEASSSARTKPSVQRSGPSVQQPSEPTWQLAREPNPAGGPDSISITKIADATRSDHDVAGLQLRCAEGATTEVLIVLTEPLPTRTHPKVTVVAGATTTEFTASVEAPGALVLLPEKASALVEGAWQSIPELVVTITESRHSLHGAIPLTDIGTAIATLQSNCPKAAHSR
jgi:hypothetical protein